MAGRNCTLSISPMKVVLNDSFYDFGDRASTCDFSAAIFEDETMYGSSVSRQSSRRSTPSSRSSFPNSRRSLQAGFESLDAELSCHYGSEFDESNSTGGCNQNRLQAASPEVAGDHFALEMEIAAAELKVAQLRAEAAAKRARATGSKHNGIAQSVPIQCGPPGESIGVLSTSPLVQQSSASISNGDGYTSVIIRNLPNDYTRDMLIELLESSGFGERFNFVYVPFDFKKQCALGYAFVNLETHEDAKCIKHELSGFCDWKVPSRKICEVAWSSSWQGLEANIERYRNSPVMHPEVPDKFKPALYKNGSPIPFPPPTKAFWKPSQLRCV